MILTDTNEHLVIKRPDNSANNLIIGKLYGAVHGTLEIQNLTRGTKAVLTIHRQGWTKRNAFKVEGKVLDNNGVCKYEVNGLWNKEMSIKNCLTGKEELMWQVSPYPFNYQRQYGF